MPSRALSETEKAAYDAPFPDESFKAGARRFPALVPITPEHGSVAENKAAWKVLENFTKPFLTAFSDSDPVTNGGEKIFLNRVPGAKGQEHVTIADGWPFPAGGQARRNRRSDPPIYRIDQMKGEMNEG